MFCMQFDFKFSTPLFQPFNTSDFLRQVNIDFTIFVIVNSVCHANLIVRYVTTFVKPKDGYVVVDLIKPTL